MFHESLRFLSEIVSGFIAPTPSGEANRASQELINERDIVTISRCVDGADFDRQEYVRACNLLQGYMNRHSDETVITDNSQEEFDPDPEAYYVDVETLAGTVHGVC